MMVRNAFQGRNDFPLVLSILLSLAAGPAAAVPATGEAVRAAVVACVEDAFSSGGDPEVICNHVPALGELEGRDLEIRASLFRDPFARGPVVVTVDFLGAGGERIARRVVSADARVWTDAAVAARRLGRHEMIDAEAVRMERIDLREAGDGVFRSPEKLIGLRVRRTLPEGKTIVSGAVEAVPVVKRGEKVMLMASVGGITVSASAVCQDDGAEGDRVAVKNDRSGKRLTGVVLGRGMVWVDIGDLPGWGG